MIEKYKTGASVGVGSELQEMGVKLSQGLMWSGIDIMCVAKAALTDANFHHEARVIEQLIADNIPL